MKAYLSCNHESFPSPQSNTSSLRPYVKTIPVTNHGTSGKPTSNRSFIKRQANYFDQGGTGITILRTPSCMTLQRKSVI